MYSFPDSICSLSHSFYVIRFNENINAVSRSRPEWHISRDINWHNRNNVEIQIQSFIYNIHIL